MFLPSLNRNEMPVRSSSRQNTRMIQADTTRILESLRADRQCTGAFASLRVDGARLVCQAKGAEAEYALEALETGWRISLSTADRWLSESIESQLVESRESLEELLEEELKDLDCNDPAPKMRHFRNEAKRFVFECTFADSARARTYFLAFESMFRQLGDMSESGGH